MKREQICWEKVRAVCIVKTMAKAGHFPKRETEKEAWFLSPFRPETYASFKVSKIKNLWFDHGAGFGGNVLDLVVRFYDCRLLDALDFLSDVPSSLSFHPQPFVPSSNDKLIFKSANPIWHYGLKVYLEQRNITLETANKYCKEVHYSRKENTISVSDYKTIPVDGNFATCITRVPPPLRTLPIYQTEVINWW